MRKQSALAHNARIPHKVVGNEAHSSVILADNMHAQTCTKNDLERFQHATHAHMALGHAP